MTARRTVRLQDYSPPAYAVPRIALDFDLYEDHAEVRAELHFERQAATAPGTPLVLDGHGLELVALRLDGAVLPNARTAAMTDVVAPADMATAYTLTAEQLTVHAPPAQGVLQITTRIEPQHNTALEGLYRSQNYFVTQCEAEGFRRIMFFPDRPDVMTRFTVTLRAERMRYPILLSNGNLIEQGELPAGRHFARWEDPFPKPCYLFALVAGDLAALEDRFRTQSGREVLLQVYADRAHVDQCAHALESLQHAMRWDEQRYGREYDLDRYMIVAIDDFNMGAMENKGLNLFNAHYVLASPQTATDTDYQNIEAVIGHEYFHNWTGNRITCRDWFQLSLKEGLTVFRDQEFSAERGSAAVKRIADVRVLRSAQFPEDAGPLAHPVRPDAYEEIDNFYTMTVYNKGAEIIRMYQTLLGTDGFRRGMDLYFERHDGQAVTIDDFLAAMADANAADLAQFHLWYTQAGTPELHVSGDYDAAARRFSLRVRQQTPPTPRQPAKKPLHIPLAMGLLGADGAALPLRLADGSGAAADTLVLELRAAEEAFEFIDVAQPPVPSLLRGYSAPVKLYYDYSDAELALLLARDTDPFNRFEASQQFALRLLLRRVRGEAAAPDLYIDALRELLRQPADDAALIAQCLSLPDELYIGEQLAVIDVDAVHAARAALRAAMATGLAAALRASHERCNDPGAYRYTPEAAARRALRNICLELLAAQADGRALAYAQFERAGNMTDTLAALNALNHAASPERAQALDAFYDRWQDEPLVVNKWFRLHAAAPLPETVEQAAALLLHPRFTLTNPNKVRAVLGVFAHGNPVAFHRSDGAGYRLVADQVLALDALNGQIAARLASALSRWRRYPPARQALMRTELERIAGAARSKNVAEIAGKALAAE